MSDVYLPEVNPDDEPGERLREGLRGSDNNDRVEHIDDVDDHIDDDAESVDDD